ncbi:ferritin-like domain-containing protein [Nocardioides sp. STR2]|uniref:Ferritin-like domain-containing protein n=1 Tax=Nocardioides pini TaxID=2975053 RepID=A0ABT4CFM9_9ACTN|nr:ferritin-like domain-containing protein [Nocardioides pini]MCY4727621.1 ferritin-like domain-containing protein [Nocardioides pini]
MSVLDALQATLADEHAALYTYGVLGARTSQASSPALFETLTAGYRRHRARRDQLQLMVRDAGGDPVAAEPAYDLDGSLLRPPQLERAAADLEASSVEMLLALVAQSTGAVREWALTEATWSAVHRLRLGEVAETWPGAPELDRA